MSHRSGRHTHRESNAVPVREFLASAGTLPSLNASGSLALRRPANVTVALTAAAAIAFAPMVATQAPPVHLALPAVHVSDIHLSAVISDADIKNLVKAVNSGLDQLDSTVANVAGLPGQTLAGALTAASSLTDNFWTTLVSASKSNPLLSHVLSALQTVTSGGLTKLAATTTAANGIITLSTQQVASLLTSTLSGAAGTVLYAAANVLNNPLSLVSYAGLVNAPITIAGGVLSNTATAVSDLGTNGVSLIGDVITGATGQVTNLIDAANDVFTGIKQTINNQQVNALITIAQAIVTSPLTAAVTIVNGGTSALADAASTAVQVAATALQRVGNIWLGNGTSGGELQNIVSTIAAGPLSPGSYVNVAGEVITGVAETANQVGSAVVAGLLPLPFKTSATVVNTAANALNNLADGLASATVSALEFAGVNSFFANTVYGLVGAIKTVVSLTAGTISTALNAVAALAATASSVTGLYNPAAASPAAATTVKALAATPATSTKSASTTAKSPTATGSVAPAATAATATKVADAIEAKLTATAASTSASGETKDATSTTVTTGSGKTTADTSGKTAASSATDTAGKSASTGSALTPTHTKGTDTNPAPTTATETGAAGATGTKSTATHSTASKPAATGNGKHSAVGHNSARHGASGASGHGGK